MLLQSLFNVRTTKPLDRAPAPGGMEMDADSAAPATSERQGVFVTPQSLTSFAGATGVVTILWNVVRSVHPGSADSKVVPLICSIVVGIIIYLISETDPARGHPAPRDRAISLLVAVINTAVLFSAVIGATVLTS